MYENLSTTDPLTVMPDGTVRAFTFAALMALPAGTVIRDDDGLVGEIDGTSVRKMVRWCGDRGEYPLSEVVLNPLLGVEVLAGPSRGAAR